MSAILTKIWYSQTHLNLLNFVKGHTAEITETNPLENQIGVHYIKVNRFIRNVTSGIIFNRYVLVAYVFFIMLHLLTLPLYILVYTFYLLINIWRAYVYIQDPKVLELQAHSIFKRFPNQWTELIYNMLYRRAVVAAFVTVYKLLQLIKTPKHNSAGVCELPTLLSKLTLLLIRFVCVVLFRVSWQIVSRSYRFAMAFSSEYSYEHFDINIVRGLIINNYQLDDLRPGLYLQIYKDDKCKWNFK